MAINDLYEVTHVMRSTITNEEFMNKWYFNCVEVIGGAENLFNAFNAVGGLRSLVNGIQALTVANKLVRVINLFSETDFYEAPVTGTGSKSGDMLPLFNALNISLKLDSRGVRPGSKRIGGLVEASSTNGQIDDATTLASIAALVAAIPENLVDGSTGVFDPVVIKRLPVAATATTSAHHRLPANAGEAEYAHVVAALANVMVSHQVSRGNGR